VVGGDGDVRDGAAALCALLHRRAAGALPRKMAAVLEQIEGHPQAARLNRATRERVEEARERRRTLAENAWLRALWRFLYVGDDDDDEEAVVQ